MVAAADDFLDALQFVGAGEFCQRAQLCAMISLDGWHPYNALDRRFDSSDWAAHFEPAERCMHCITAAARRLN